MAGLKLSHIYKVYDNGHKAVNDFSIDIKDKEFIVFVGPSGCGKSTTLRMIAGLETITAGDLFIGDTLVNDMEPKDRDIAMVFQSYALYPHMTVYENMAFGLRNQHILTESQIKEKVENAAKILDIEEYLDKKPKEMSGGQRQRVALGRALVRDPKVFLLDEPLSNLDAKLRAQMRTEITKLHKSLATTFIYVTHDQVEAMTMGTRIVVMKLGYVQQIDTPMNLYNEPYNKFVAGFIGSPQMNFFNVKLIRNKDNVIVTFNDGATINLPYERLARIHDSYLTGEKSVTLGIRPEHIKITKNKGLKCYVNAVEHLGNECIVYAKLGDHAEEFSMKDVGNDVVFKVVEGTDIDVGNVVKIMPVEEKVHFFDSETEITLMQRIPEFSSINGKVTNGKIDIFNSLVDLPEVFEKALDGSNEFVMEISPSNIVKGNDFKLKVHKIEKINNDYLAYLEYRDKYVFALVDENVKEGEEYRFSIVNEKVRLFVDDKQVISPISDNVELVGTFEKQEKKEKKERIYHFYYRIGDSLIEAPIENGYKINSIDGNACYRNTYKYSINRSKVRLVDSDGIKGIVKKVLRYNNATYALVNVNDNEILVTVDESFDKKEVNICFNSEDVEVYSTNIDMKIC